MRLIRLKAPGGLENLKLVEEGCPEPGPGELLVRIRACSLNFHDSMVALGKKPCADGRIPLSDSSMQDGRPHRTDRCLDRLCRASFDPGPVFQSD